ncbi:MAG: hypothetical protein II862_03755 [Bacteroidales bacterium]|nr:hypothetical protein [Bacteroidales bacterium]
MKKTLKMWMLAAILICSTALVSCGNKNTKEQPKEATVENNQVVNVFDSKACDAAVANYLENVIGKQYAEGQYSISSPFVISTDNGDLQDVKVWGDFWVFNYNVSGDTLKTVSGGSHPGLMHLRTTDDGYEVTKFEAVEDGSEYLPSAKRIFGDKFDAFQEISSAAEKREDIRLRNIADYVKKHNLKVTMVQDYGWPAVELPK